MKQATRRLSTTGLKRQKFGLSPELKEVICSDLKHGPARGHSLAKSQPFVDHAPYCRKHSSGKEKQHKYEHLGPDPKVPPHRRRRKQTLRCGRATIFGEDAHDPKGSQQGGTKR